MKVVLGLIAFLVFVLGGILLFTSTRNNTLTALINPSVQTPSPLTLSYPTLQTIFDNDISWIATLSAKHLHTIIVTGDVIPARSVNAGVYRRNNPLWPYEKVTQWFKDQNADVVFINLETPLISQCPVTEQGMVFCGDSGNIKGLQAIGTTIASLANNHAGNYGKKGVDATTQSLKNVGITPTGLGKPIYKTLGDITFAFLGFNDIAGGEKMHGIATAEKEDIRQQIQEARKHADTIIVMFHWGIEYQDQPDERQRYLAYFTIDNGTDLVLSNHPHWIQPVEIYKGKYIMYAHGNFIFDQMWSQKTREGVIGKYIFYDNQLIDVVYTPLQISDYGQASFLEGERKKEVLGNLQKQSERLQLTPMEPSHTP